MHIVCDLLFEEKYGAKGDYKLLVQYGVQARIGAKGDYLLGISFVFSICKTLWCLCLHIKSWLNLGKG